MFRVKIALLSVLISGLILAGFGLYFLSVINKAGMDRIDRELLALGGSQLHAPPWAPVWQNLYKSLHFIYDEKGLNTLIVHVTGPEERLYLKSPDWPREISEAAFPEFDHERLPLHDLEAFQRSEHAARDSGAPSDRDAGLGATGSDHPDDSSRIKIPPGLNNGNGQRRPRLLLPSDDKVYRKSFPATLDDPLFRLPPVRIKKACFRTIKTTTGSWRVAIIGNQWVTAMIGMNMGAFFRESERFKNAFLITLPLALLLLGAGGWLIAHRAMRPVAMLTRAAEGITARALEQRIPRTGADAELSRLVDVINNMLERLQKSFGQAIRFSADAAHELQTPLTILQGELDDAVQNAPTGSEEQRRYGALLEEVQQLKSIVQKLLILARADAGKLVLHLQPVDLSAMIESAVEDTGVIAPYLQIEKDLTPRTVVKADPDLLRLVIHNLMSNAVKYNVEKGLVRFELKVRGSEVRFTISNTGKPIPAVDRDRIFDRFYRVDKSRSRAVPGAGLGLSLAREIAYAHQGDLSLNPGPGNVIRFTLSLPSAT